MAKNSPTQHNIFGKVKENKTTNTDRIQRTKRKGGGGGGGGGRGGTFGRTSKRNMYFFLLLGYQVKYVNCGKFSKNIFFSYFELE